MLRRLLVFLIICGLVVAAGLNFKPILRYGEAKLVEAAAQTAINAQNWTKAIEIYETGLREHPQNVEIAERLGWLYQQAGQMEKAGQLYRSMLQADPDNLPAQLGLGQIAAASPEHFNDAVLVYRKALKKHPDNAELLYQIGNLYKAAAENPKETRASMRKWLFDQARYYYQMSLRSNPRQFLAQFNLGIAYQQQENLQPAAKAYCQAITLNPASFEARYNLGLILSELNYLEEAYRQMGQAVQLASQQTGEEGAMQLARRVQNIKNSIYNNTSRQGLSAKGKPEFLDEKCLVTLQAASSSASE
jgi:tetratricopeptide (TPR) repeat protein